MKRIRLRTIAVFAMAGVTGAILLHTSQSVQRAEDQLAALKSSITQEKDSIKLLNAEWAYLNNPERIENLARQYLDIKTPSVGALTANAADIPSPDEIVAPLAIQANQPEIKTSPPKPESVAFKPSPPKTPPPSPAKFSAKDFHALIKNLSKGGGR